MNFRSWKEFREKNEELKLGLYTKKDLGELDLKPGPDTPWERHRIAYEGHYSDYILYKNAHTLPIKRRKTVTRLAEATTENLCAALYHINKSAKVSRDTKTESYEYGDYGQVSRSKTRQLGLYHLKDKALKKMVKEGRLLSRGYHEQVNQYDESEPYYLEYFTPADPGLPFSFHMPTTLGQIQKKSLKKLGVIPDKISADKEKERTLLNFNESKLLLESYVRKERKRRREGMVGVMG